MTIMTLTVKRILMALLLAAGALGAGCNGSRESRDAGGGGGSGGGGGGGATSTVCSGTLNGSCRYNVGTYCFEYTGVPSSDAVAMLAAMCQEDGLGNWEDTPCVHTGALGACRRMQGTACQAQWVLSGSLEDAMADCADDMGTWISP